MSGKGKRGWARKCQKRDKEDEGGGERQHCRERLTGIEKHIMLAAKFTYLVIFCSGFTWDILERIPGIHSSCTPYISKTNTSMAKTTLQYPVSDIHCADGNLSWQLWVFAACTTFPIRVVYLAVTNKADEYQANHRYPETLSEIC